MGSRASELQLQGLDLFTKPMEECPKIGHPFEDLTTDDPDVKGNLVCASKVKECEDVVLHLTAPHNSWITGKVIHTISDKTRVVPQVRIKTKTSMLDRPITKICLLQESG